MTDNPTPIPLGGGQTGERCEPPGELKNRDGWHWIEGDGGELFFCQWTVSKSGGYDGTWDRGTYWSSAEHAAADGWIYRGRVPSPSDLAALVRAGREMRGYVENAVLINPCDETISDLEALTAALAKFPEVGG